MRWPIVAASAWALCAAALDGARALSPPSFTLGTQNFATGQQNTANLQSQGGFGASSASTAMAVDGTVPLAAAASWLTFTAPATLSGTPFAGAPPVRVWITGTDGNGAAVTQNVLVTVDDKPPPLPMCGGAGGASGISLQSCTGSPPPTAVLNQSYTLKLPTGLFVGTNLAMTAAMSPTNVTWLKFDPSQLQLFGTPDQLTSVDVTVTATDPVTNAQAIVHVPISVSSTAPSGSSSSSTAAIVGGIVGGIAAILLVGLLILWIVRRRRAKRARQSTGKLEAPAFWNHTGSLVAGDSERTLGGSGVAPSGFAARHKHSGSVSTRSANLVTEPAMAAAATDGAIASYLIPTTPLPQRPASTTPSPTSSHALVASQAAPAADTEPSAGWFGTLGGTLRQAMAVPAFLRSDEAVEAERLEGGAGASQRLDDDKPLPPLVGSPEARAAAAVVPPAAAAVVPPLMGPPVVVPPSPEAAGAAEPLQPLVVSALAAPADDRASLYTRDSGESRQSVDLILSDYAQNGGPQGGRSGDSGVGSGVGLGLGAAALATVAAKQTSPEAVPAQPPRPVELAAAAPAEPASPTPKRTQVPVRRRSEVKLGSANMAHDIAPTPVAAPPPAPLVTQKLAPVPDGQGPRVVTLKPTEAWAADFSYLANAGPLTRLGSALRRTMSRSSRKSTADNQSIYSVEDGIAYGKQTVLRKPSDKRDAAASSGSGRAPLQVGLKHVDPQNGYTLIYEVPSWLALSGATVSVAAADSEGKPKVPGRYSFVMFRNEPAAGGAAASDAQVQIADEFFILVEA